MNNSIGTTLVLVLMGVLFWLLLMDERFQQIMFIDYRYKMSVIELSEELANQR